MGNFDINLSPEDEQQLKQLAKDTSYSQLAGGFQKYAAGEMALGAGQGMAKGGAGTEGAFLGAGFGLASAFGAQQAQASRPSRPQAAQQRRPSSGMPSRRGRPAGAAPAAAGSARPARASGSARARGRRRGPVCASCQAPNPAGREVLHGLRPGARARRPALHRVRHRTPGRRPLLRRLRHPGRRLRAPSSTALKGSLSYPRRHDIG